MTTLNNDKVRLRALEPTDVDWLYTAENDSRLWAVTDTVAPFSRQLMWQYLKDYNADIYHTRELRLVVERVDD
ncbi:MAG: N-acetyltransferase, partial [Muribaculaceae bacterium]|nr:N-acetyltransferase [Muribaculaceae bacterium]